jgi:nucleotide-binding universal stress UspA family protein
MIPPQTILAPVDFSDASRASLQCAAALAGHWSASLHVVHVLDPLLAAAAETRRIDLVADARDELESFCRDSHLKGAAPVVHIGIGAAADVICDTAEAQGADLIVAGSRGLSGLNRLVMGTTIEKVIRRARTSVLAVPGRCPADDAAGWGPIVAAIDDPAQPQPVAGAAAALARALGAPLHLVHVVPPLPALARWRAEADNVRHARSLDARRALDAAIGRLEGVEPASVHIANGIVADALAAETGRHTRSTPILVLGRAAPGQGHAPGAVASRVIARATTPVWVYLEASSL